MFFKKILIVTVLYLAYLQIGTGQVFENWGYWLTDINPEMIHDSEYEMVVIDYSRTGSDPFTGKEVAYMKERGDGGKRMVISYFSIGEAEEYRYYWDDDWKINEPVWMDEENPDWPGNYKVKYWEPSWQKILFGHSSSYLDQIMKSGFDGVYLDIVDAFEYFEDKRPTAEREMVDLIISMARYARLQNPYFKIIIQNGERILANDDLVKVIDGVAKEDLYFGLEADDIPAANDEIEFSLEYLKKAKRAGKFVLLASYVPQKDGKELVIEQAKKHGFIPYFSDRDLDKLYKHSGLKGEEYERKMLPTSSQRTPGDFFLHTLHKGQFKTSIATLTYDEKSVYSEKSESGEIVFSEDVSYTDRIFPVHVEYGLTKHIEVGVRVPLALTTLELDEKIGGDAMSRESEFGLSNIALTANMFLPFKKGTNIFSLLSMEYGIPTDTKSGNLKSGSFAVISYNIEKVWDHFGIAAGTGLSNFNLSASLDNTQFVYRGGLLGIFSDRVFGDVFYTKRGDRSFVEVSAEVLISRHSSLDFYFAHDLMGDVQIKNYGMTFTFFH